MNCIICDNPADEVGSHYVPASLIKKCVGKRNREESYEIDIEGINIDIYFGRQNLKNTSEERKGHHYTKDHILCKVCEKKLGDLESEFSKEFLEKFREQKYSSNFKSYNLPTEFEVYEPLRIKNVKILAYFYSIIYRYCKVLSLFDGIDLLKTVELNNIKTFLHNILYNTNDYSSIAKYKLVITFTKHSSNGFAVTSSPDFENPYLFFFCESIIQLYTNELSSEAKLLFENCFNEVKDSESKIIVGPDSFYQSLVEKMNEKFALEFMEGAINNFCKMNGKSFEENKIELNMLSALYNSKKEFKSSNSVLLAIQEMKKKYSS